MRKRLLALTGTVLWFGAGMGYAQDAPGVPRYEVGAQFTSPYLREFSTVLGRRTELGLGGRFTVNLTDLLAAETQVDLYPKDEFFPDRRKIQAVFGIRAGVRKRRVGLFGKLRPGLVHVREPLRCVIPEGCSVTGPRYSGRLWLAVDTGAVFEVYPSDRLAFRVDAGDLFVRRFDYTDGEGKRFYYSSHNLQIGGGVGWRF
jgi:hypothetical protein